MKKSKLGEITLEPGATPEKSELKTAAFFANLGYDIKLLKPIDQDHVQSPDILMNGEKWEIKCPRGRGKYLIQNTLHSALHQSPNVVINLYRIKIRDENCRQQIIREFNLSKGIRKLIVITKLGEKLDFAK